MIDENGQGMLVGKKHSCKLSIVTTNMIWWSLFSLSLPKLCVGEREKEQTLEWTSRNFDNVWSNKRNRNQRTHFHLLSSVAEKQTDVW
jgi:hypothetical protein